MPIDRNIIYEMIGATSPHKRYLTIAKRRRNFTVPRSRPLGGNKLTGRNVSEEEQVDEMTAKHFIKIGKQNGHIEAGATGGHTFLVNPKTGVKTTIPAHKGDLPIGTARSIAKSLGDHIYQKLRSQRKLEEQHNQTKQNVIRNLRKKLKAEEAIEQGGRTDTGSTGDNIRLNPRQTDRVNTKPIKNVDQGQTR